VIEGGKEGKGKERREMLKWLVYGLLVFEINLLIFFFLGVKGREEK